ncbi:MAG: LPS assembly protein LptD [Sulfurovum sp.]
MSKLFQFCLYLFLIIDTSYAIEGKNKIEITANELESTKTTVVAKGKVLVYYNDSIITASLANFNRTTKILTLDGKVESIGYQGTKEHTDHMVINTKTSEVTFGNLFMSTKSDVWIVSNSAHKLDNNYTFDNSIISSCDASNPLWKIAFSDSKYYSKDEYMKLYHARMYFANVPIFYTPYLAFTTNNKRSSGLLFPAVGYSEEDGYFYEQPIYWAISDNMDLEINPQIRTNRTKGLYGTFRFADSQYSKGTLRAGYFEDKPSYTEANNLPNPTHYGVEFNYESSQVISSFLPSGFKDGFYLNTTYLNDIEYLNLQQGGLSHFGLTPLQESRANYFLDNEDYYLGVNAKYFIDTTKVDNNRTLQILPSVQLHKYLTHIIWDNLTYSVDLHSTNLTRIQGSTLNQYELKIPIEFTTSLFNDFLSISVGEEVYYTKLYFANETYIEDKYRYYNNIEKAKIFTDLTKKYDSFVHVIQPSIGYISRGKENHYPISYSSLEDNQTELFSVGVPEKQFNISFGQYFYDNSAKLIFYQRVKQNFYEDRNITKKQFSDINNEMQLNLGRWSFYNNIIYSPEYNRVRESSSRISFAGSIFNFNMGHLYKQTITDTTNKTTLKDINLGLNLKITDKLKIDLSAIYDIDEEEPKQWSIGIHYHRDCWGVDASLRRDMMPRVTGSTLPPYNNAFFIQFTFRPFGSFGSAAI